EPACKIDEVRTLPGAQSIFQTLDKRAFLIVLEDHLSKPAVVDERRSAQSWKERALFFGLVMVVCKRTQEMQQAFNILLFDGLSFPGPCGHFVQNVQRSQNGLMFSDENIRAFHASFLFRFRNACARARSAEDS